MAQSEIDANSDLNTAEEASMFEPADQ